MKYKHFITKYNGKIISLLESGNQAVQLSVEPGPDEGPAGGVGDIYLGNVENVVKSLGGAFVDIGSGRNGFLKLSHGDRPFYFNRGRDDGQLRQGDLILVQTASDEMKSKPASFTCDISLPGVYSVLVPAMEGIRVSSRIKGKLPEEMEIAALEAAGSAGAILRSAAEHASTEDIVRELHRLAGEWESITEEAGRKRKGLIRSAQPCYIRDILDFGSDTDRIITDDRLVHKELVDTFAANADICSKISLYEDRKVPLSVIAGLEKAISDALQTKVYLKCGGFLLIEHTQTLTTIDVNSGKSQGGASPEREALDINIEAAREAARALRLRNISGMILIDFINMKDSANMDKVIRALKEALSADPVPAKFVDITRLGLAEITRKKVRAPLEEAWRKAFPPAGEDS